MKRTKYLSTANISRRRVLGHASIGAIGLAAAAAVGCGDDATNQGTSPSATTQQGGSTESPTPATKIRRGGTAVVVVPEPADLNPHTGIAGSEHQTLWLIHDNLIAYDEKSIPREDLSLAKSWEIVSPTEIVLRLRDGVTFHDGTKLTSDVVKYNLQLVLDPSTAAVSRGQIAPIQTIETPDDYTVRLKLSAPSASLLLALGDRGGMIVSRTALEAQGLKGYAVNPKGGTGAFQFESWVRNSGIKLKRNPAYWRKRADAALPNLDNLDLKFIPEAAVALAALQAGEVRLSPVSDEDVKVIESNKSLSSSKFIGASTFQVWGNRNSPVFKDPRARQALSYAIDREAMVIAITDGRSEKALGPITPAQWAFDSKLKAPTYDLKQAKALFESAGIPSGSTVSLVTYAAGDIYKRQAQIIQESLRQIGIELKPEFLETAAVYAEYKKGKHDLAMSGFSTRADPHGSLGEQYLSKGGFAWTQNPSTGELEPEVDKLLIQANQEYDIEKRKPLYSTIQDMIVNKYAMVSCMYYGNLYLGQAKTLGSSGPLFGGEGKPRLAELFITEG